MRHSIVVGIGNGKKVREGLAVTAEGALIGTIAEVGPWHSRVALLTDGESRIPCRVQRTRDLCILEGTGGTNCTVKWVGREWDLKRGDILVTAPLEGALSEPPPMPPGLPAARIVRARSGRTQPLFQDVTARPQVTTERLERVEVILPSHPRTGSHASIPAAVSRTESP